MLCFASSAAFAVNPPQPQPLPQPNFARKLPFHPKSTPPPPVVRRPFNAAQTRKQPTGIHPSPRLPTPAIGGPATAAGKARNVHNAAAIGGPARPTVKNSGALNPTQIKRQPY